MQGQPSQFGSSREIRRASARISLHLRGVACGRHREANPTCHKLPSSLFTVKGSLPLEYGLLVSLLVMYAAPVFAAFLLNLGGVLLVLLFAGPCAAAPELQLPGTSPMQKSDNFGRGNWQALEPGLELAEFKLPDSESRLTVLRIDPEYFDFLLCAASASDKQQATLGEWGAKEGLSAAINASMYLPDNLTSTGYMRSGAHINNGRIMERFGAFFVSGPRKEGLPQAQILDRDNPDWRALLDDYETVVQNYRMTNSQRRILWSPGGPHYSISAVAQDGTGKILFLHSRMPLEAYSFVQQLLHLPLDVRTIMYVEGGAQAGLLVQSGNLKRELSGLHAPSFLVTGNMKARLPNVLGIRARKREPAFAGVADPVN